MAPLVRVILATSLGLASVSCVPARAVPVEIAISQFAFPTTPRTIHVGDTVTWINKDVVEHSATGRKNEFNTDIKANATATTKVETPGTIEYFCRFHPNMTGQLIVTE